MRAKFQVEITDLSKKLEESDNIRKILQNKLISEKKDLLKKETQLKEIESERQKLLQQIQQKEQQHKQENENAKKNLKDRDTKIAALSHDAAVKNTSIGDKEKQLTILNFQNKKLTELLKEREEKEKKIVQELEATKVRIFYV